MGPTGMPGHFTTVEVTDPRRILQLISQSLPPGVKSLADEQALNSSEYAPLDLRRFRIEPDSYRMVWSTASIGALRASRITQTRATQLVRSPLSDAYIYMSVFERGATRVVFPWLDEPVIGSAATGVIAHGLGARSATTDGSAWRLLRLPTALLSRKLGALLDGRQPGAIAFQPAFDQTRGAGATLRRMLDFLLAELEHSDSLLTNEIAIRSFEENLALCLLLGLPHNYTAALEQQKAAAAPGNVRRAEAFLRAHVDMALTVDEIAAAAGCGVRALQLAFQRFRGTTPLRALQQARLDRARQEILRTGRTDSLARVAAVYGFSNPTRFARLFRQQYGVYPSEMQRTGRGALAGWERPDPYSPGGVASRCPVIRGIIKGNEGSH